MLRAIVLLLSSFTLFACASSGPVSTNSAAVAAVKVEIDPSLEGDKTEILNDYGIPAAMTAALKERFQAGGDNSLEVLITRFRTGGFGPTFMNATARLVDPSGNTVKELVANGSFASGFKRRTRVENASEDVVDKIVDGL